MSHISSSGAGGGGGGSTGLLNLNVTLIDNTDSPYTVLSTDTFIGADSSTGAITIVFPDTPVVGRSYIVKDTGSNADVNNITLTSTGGINNFDNAPLEYIMNTVNQSANVIYTGANEYYIW